MPRADRQQQREFWNGKAVELETVWTLTKRNHVVQCVLFTHQLGWELRFEVGELFMTQVSKSDREVENISAGLRDAMTQKGWTE